MLVIMVLILMVVCWWPLTCWGARCRSGSSQFCSLLQLPAPSDIETIRKRSKSFIYGIRSNCGGWTKWSKKWWCWVVLWHNQICWSAKKTRRRRWGWPGGESRSKCSHPPASKRMVGLCCGRCTRNHLHAHHQHRKNNLMSWDIAHSFMTQATSPEHTIFFLPNMSQRPADKQ